MLVDKDRIILQVNNYFARLYDAPECEIVGRNMFDFLTPASKIICDSYVFPLLLHQDVQDEIRLTFVSKADSRFPIVVNAKLHDEERQITTWCFFNASQREKLFDELVKSRRLLEQRAQELQLLASTDPLTNLPNRMVLTHHLKQKMLHANVHNEVFSLAFLDLDWFKQINEKHGQPAGDCVLNSIANRIAQHIENIDFVSRYGGDEFVFILNEDPGSTKIILSKLLNELVQPIYFEEHALHVSGSVGFTFFPQGPSSQHLEPEQLIRQADQAMCAAKLKGRNNTFEFNVLEESKEVERNSFKDEVLKGIGNNEFELHYQPKINMATSDVIGFEALIRWQHPHKGLLFPIAFLPHIANCSVDIALGEWVIETALKQIQTWMREDEQIAVSVNVAGYHLQSQQFTSHLQSLFEHYTDVPFSLLELEILETSAIDDLAQVDSVLDTCKKLGISLSLDDFGTGYSTLSHLKKINVDILKIDKSFVQNMLNDEGDLAILKGILGFAKAFGRDVIAEGVETQEHMDALLRLGCYAGQGYFIAKPMPAERAMTWLKEWRLAHDGPC